MRLDLGLRQRTLAERLGVRTETLANWERGRARSLARHHSAVVCFLGYDPEPVADTAGGRLRRLRRRLGLTQRQLAIRLALDEGTVTEFELGRRKVAAKVRRVVAKFIAEHSDLS